MVDVQTIGIGILFMVVIIFLYLFYWNDRKRKQAEEKAAFFENLNKQPVTFQLELQHPEEFDKAIKAIKELNFREKLQIAQLLFGRTCKVQIGTDGKETWIEGIIPFFPNDEDVVYDNLSKEPKKWMVG